MRQHPCQAASFQAGDEDSPGAQHIAVGHHNPRVGGGNPSFDDVVELGIRADAFIADQQSRRNMRMQFDQASHQGYDRIARLRHAEQNLIVGIVQTEARQQRFFGEIFQAADGSTDRDALEGFLSGLVRLGAVHAPHDGGDARQV